MSIADDIMDTAKAGHAAFVAGLECGSPALNAEARSKLVAALDIAVSRLHTLRAACTLIQVEIDTTLANLAELRK